MKFLSISPIFAFGERKDGYDDDLNSENIGLIILKFLEFFQASILLNSKTKLLLEYFLLSEFSTNSF